MWRPCGIFDATYEKDMAIIRTSRHWIALIVSLVILFLVPLFGSYYIVTSATIEILIEQGLLNPADKAAINEVIQQISYDQQGTFSGITLIA